jgi:REP element-mobilizing transposase RayT
MVFPQGYHITFGTYGARLHGSSKPHVDCDHNEYGEPFAPTDPSREQASGERMKYDPVSLTVEQRVLVESAITDVCSRYSWPLHTLAAQSDHIHVVLTAPRDGPELREAIKAVASRALNKQFGKRRWWAEGGSAKYLWETDYFHAAIKYVKDQRDF